MARYQFTIGRLMLVVIVAAGLLAASRAFGATLGLMFLTSLSMGWLAWRIALGRPRLALGGVVGALVAWPVAAVLAPIGGPSPVIEAGATLLFLGYPSLLGLGLAWCQADEQRGTARRLAATVGLSLLAVAYLPLLGILIVRAVR